MPKFDPWVTLQEALEADLEPRLPTIFEIGQTFAREPRAPKGDWTIPARDMPNKQNPARAYVVKRMAEVTHTDVRSPQRWIGKFLLEERNPSKAHMAQLRAGARPSAINQTLDILSRYGTGVNIHANIKITSTYHADRWPDDDRHRIVNVFIFPDAELASKDQTWEQFIRAWRIGDFKEGAEKWQEAFFAAIPIGSGTGEIYDVEWLWQLQIESMPAAA